MKLLDIKIDTSLPSQRVIQTLDHICEWRAKPKIIRLDIEPELSALTAVFEENF